MIFDWAKVWTDILGDPKLMRAARKGARGLELLPWFITFAKKADDDGRLSVGGEPAEAADFVPLIPGQTLRSISRALKSLQELDVLEEDEEGALRFTAWESRQQRSGEGPRPSANGRSSYVYYARDGDVVKIGCSRNPWARCADLRAHRPGLALLAVEPGDFALERQRQSELAGRTDFRNHRLGSEWFPWTPEIEAFVSRLTATKSPASKATGSATGSTLPSLTTKEESRVDTEEIREETPPTPATPLGRLLLALPAEYHVDLYSLLERVPDKAAWCGELLMAVEGGTSGLGVSYEDLGRAIRDFKLNGKTQVPEIALLRAYVKRASSDRRRPPVTRPQSPANKPATTKLPSVLP